MNQNTKELEMQACRTFVCPSLILINEKGKELELRDETIKRAKDMAIEYFKKTYHAPHYSSAKYVLPASIYIASIFENDRRSQIDVADVFGVSSLTVTRWYRDIMEVLDIKTLVKERKSEILCRDINNERGKFAEKISGFMDKIEKQGEMLSLKDDTITKAKELAIRYFKVADFKHYYSHVGQLLPAFIYTASVIENDRRTQLEIANVSGVVECVVSQWHTDILKTLHMKIIGHRKHVITVLEEQDD